MDSLPPGHHPDWRTSVLLLIWGTASPEGFLGAGGSCLPRYAGAPREHGLAMLGAPGGLYWTGSPSTHQWAYPAHTRGSFRFTTKGTKGVPGALPLDPVGGLLSSPQRRQAPLPSRKGCLFGWHASHKPPAAPRIDSRKCSLDGTKGKNKTDLSTSSKWQIDLIFVVEGSPARCVSERSKGGDYAPGDSKGHSPWRAFGDFPRVGKVTRGGGAERPPG